LIFNAHLTSAYRLCEGAGWENYKIGAWKVKYNISIHFGWCQHWKWPPLAYLHRKHVGVIDMHYHVGWFYLFLGLFSKALPPHSSGARHQALRISLNGRQIIGF